MNVMRERRLRAAIPTQQEVAKAMGVQVSTISARLALPAEARALRARLAALGGYMRVFA